MSALKLRTGTFINMVLIGEHLYLVECNDFQCVEGLDLIAYHGASKYCFDF